jgi:hypothetical protein
MKQKIFLTVMLSFLFSGIIAALFGPVIGAASLISSVIPKESGAMMGLQREIWLPDLQLKYEQKRDWMNHMTDLSEFVDEYQVLHFAEIGDYPAVYVNRTTDVDSVEPTETPNQATLDTYDSQNYKIRKIGLYAIPYRKVEFYTAQSSEAIRLREARTAAYAVSPDAPGANKIIIPSTGDNDGTGLCKILLRDIATLAQAMDNYKFPEAQTGRHLVLTTNQWWQLVNDNEILKGQIIYQQKVGEINPMIVNYYGITIHRYDSGVGYDVDADAKAAQGTVIGGDVVPFGFCYCTRETWKGEGAWSMFDKPVQSNTGGRAHEFGFQHRFKAGVFRKNQQYTAGIYSAKVPAGGSDASEG